MEIVRDPLWNNIRIDELAIQLIDTPAFQRLRYIRQLGFTYLVYPGATHSRFEHALGAYNLCKATLALMRERGELKGIDEETSTITYIAALLHDLGHYPFSHALEEIGATHHEKVAYPIITSGPIARILRTRISSTAPERIYELICGESDIPLQGLISGSLDLDKIEYLRRDALMCGVPYGEIDSDRLMNSLILVQEGPNGHRTVGVSEKGLSALESLLFAKYQMYRNVYWHHAVRSATAMYKRLIEDAIEAGILSNDRLAEFTDEGLLWYLEANFESPLLTALRSRRLFKRSAEWPASDLATEADLDWVGTDRPRTRAAEKHIAATLGCSAQEVLLDYPEKTQMLGLDIPVLRRDGTVERLTGRGIIGKIDLPRLSTSLYRSARWLRVFTAGKLNVNPATLFSIIADS